MFYLTLIEVQEQNKKQDFSQHLHMIAHMAEQQLQNCVILNHKPYVMILSTQDLSGNSATMRFLSALCHNNPIRIGFSLPGKGLESAAFLLPQAKAAIRYGTASQRSEQCYHFYDYAMDYLLDTPLGRQSVHACMPAVVRLWKQERASKDDLFSTLKIYLENERSVSKTAAQMFTHRNTILYRIKKIQEILSCNLDNVYQRDYCRLSIQILNLYERI